ncbi:MAG: CPXCG motif-containing cysteine-rich protein [Pirellula sp.]|nr:CPXCG motif-containing cysteine-rich protein [Pirellula sp.]
MKILFLHGWQSVVGGVKPTHLAGAGHDVINPKLDDDDFSIALAVAQKTYDDHRPDVIVGSSRGGAVAMNISSGQTPLVLLCPAWKRWGNAKSTKPRTIILHSRSDDVIPFENSQELLETSGLGGEALLETGYDHRLADSESLSVMLWVCELLGKGGELPPIEDFEVDRAGAADVTKSQNEGAYICDSCGEEIVIPLDISEGAAQTYVEDCPVCCNANRIHVTMFDSHIEVWAEAEQDRH